MSLAADFPARVRLEQGFHPPPHQVVVVGNQNPQISHCFYTPTKLSELSGARKQIKYTFLRESEREAFKTVLTAKFGHFCEAKPSLS
jgi:hypothetical protein